MLIPVTISLLISTIFLSFGLLVKGTFLISSQGEPTKIGEVLGVSEYNGAGDILVEQDNNLNKAIIKVIEEAKSLPRPQLFQLPRLDQPMRQFPENQAKKPELVISDYDFPAQNGVILDYNDDSLFFCQAP